MSEVYIKKSFQPNVMTMHFLKNNSLRNTCVGLHMENPTLEMIVGSTSISNNIHKVIDDNNNFYRSIMMDAMRINHSYLGEEGLHIDEEPNVDTNMFFYFKKKL